MACVTPMNRPRHVVDQPANNQTRTWPIDRPTPELEINEPTGQPTIKQEHDCHPTQRHGPEALHDGLGTIRSELQNLPHDLDQFIH